MYKIRVNPVALTDLRGIEAYIIEELSSPDAAVMVVEKIILCYEQLEKYPMMGASLSAVLDIRTDYRYLVCGHYLIFYRMEGEYVSIYRILHGRRDYLQILFGDLPVDGDMK